MIKKVQCCVFDAVQTRLTIIVEIEQNFYRLLDIVNEKSPLNFMKLIQL